MSPVKISAIAFFFIFGGTLLGLWLRSIVPEHHLNDETRDLIKLGAGLIATMVALLLGLLLTTHAVPNSRRSPPILFCSTVPLRITDGDPGNARHS